MYDQNLLYEGLSAALDEHLTAVGCLNKSLLADAVECEEIAYKNQSFDGLFNRYKEEGDLVSIESLERLNEIKRALMQFFEQAHPQIKQKTFSPESYNEFLNLSNEFVLRLRRFELDINRENSGIDPLTGLRSQSVMMVDLKRELSACARRSDYLGLALGRIDDYEKLSQKLAKEDLKQLILFVGNVLKKSMRLYDDGYRFNVNKFIFCFKHTDQFGTVSVVDRFQKMMREAFAFPDGKGLEQKVGGPVTVSYVITKLEVGTDIESLLARLEQDLNVNATEAATVIEYEDVSDIQKYARLLDGE